MAFPTTSILDNFNRDDEGPPPSADWDNIVCPGTVILICDIGGGTTDFTLICVKEGKTGPVPERIAVGEHLLLGGDNMDLALARLVESRILGNSEKKLDSLRWHILTSLCRSAKEKIFYS